MALPLLPSQKIRTAFYELAPSAQDIHLSESLKAFYQYMEKQWIHGRVSPMLSVNGQNRRTNSEVEVKKSCGFDIVINILFSWVIAVTQIDWRVRFCNVGNSYLVFIDRSDQSGNLFL